MSRWRDDFIRINADRSRKQAILKETIDFQRALPRKLGHIASHVKSFTLLLFKILYNNIFDDLRRITFPSLTAVAYYHKSLFQWDLDTLFSVLLIRMPVIHPLTIGVSRSIRGSWKINFFILNCDSLEKIELRGAHLDMDTRLAARRLLGKPDIHDEAVNGSLPPLSIQLSPPSDYSSLPRSIRYLHLCELKHEDPRFSLGWLRKECDALLSEDRSVVSQAGMEIPHYVKPNDEWRSMLEEQAFLVAFE
jgi:hypothetical protein